MDIQACVIALHSRSCRNVAKTKAETHGLIDIF